MFFDNDFMEFMGYRDSVMEEEIDRNISNYRNTGKINLSNNNDLTDDEKEYVEDEIKRRSNW